MWISPDPKAHIAVTGRDDKGRKQYRYHPHFVRVRDEAKYSHVIDFAKELPKLRKRVASDLARQGLPREKVLATVVYLLERTLSRVGNETYVKENQSYGLTTLRNHHVRVQGSELKFRFLGKSGKTWQFSVESKRVAKVIRSCQELPGQHLFEYLDADGKVHGVTSEDVNAYLRDATGANVTAKDFRTWAGTVEAARALHEFGLASDKPAKTHVREALHRAAGLLGNTVAICRKCYVHPEILMSYEDGSFALPFPAAARAPKRFELSVEERAVLKFLQLRMRGGRRPRRRVAG